MKEYPRKCPYFINVILHPVAIHTIYLWVLKALTFKTGTKKSEGITLVRLIVHRGILTQVITLCFALMGIVTVVHVTTCKGKLGGITQERRSDHGNH